MIDLTGLDHGWILPQTLAVGCFPRSQGLDILARAGISVLFNLTEMAYWDPRFEIHHLPMGDGYPPTCELALDFCCRLDTVLAEGRSAYVHCFAGCGRAGTMITCHAMTRDRRGWMPVLLDLRNKRRCLVESSRQEDFLAEWEAWLEVNPYGPHSTR